MTCSPHGLFDCGHQILPISDDIIKCKAALVVNAVNLTVLESGKIKLKFSNAGVETFSVCG